MIGRRSLSLAIVVALLLAATALALRVLRTSSISGSDGFGSGTQLLPLLFAAAGLCVAGLLRERGPAGAWLAAVGVAGITALEILGAVRARQLVGDQQAWPLLVLIADLALLGAAAIAGGYAIRADLLGRIRGLWQFIVVAGLAVVAMTGVWSAVQELGSIGVLADPNATELPPLRISGRLAAGYVAVMALAGIWGDLRGPLRRARARSATARDLPRAVVDELLPSAAAAQRRGRDEERARLAADLHALVLPDLRRAAQAAEASDVATAGDRPRPVAPDLRQAVEGVERLMHQRQSIVLEEYGVVAALEWLAERTEQRGGLVVEIELDGADVGTPAAIPPAIARAAFRVALLAVDNVVRHARASRALIRLDVDAGRGRLAVVDDGVGIEDAVRGRGGRGVIDMRAAAAEVGAKLKVERRPGGTAVELTWATLAPTAGQHATRAADLPARPQPPGA